MSSANELGRWFAVGLGLAALLAARPLPAAQGLTGERTHEYETGLGESVVVPEGTTATHGLLALCGDVRVDGSAVGDAVAIGGDVHVRGRVEGDALSIGGRVHVAPGGVVTGNAFSLFGGVDREEGGVVQGRVRSLASVENGPPGYFDVAFSRPVLVARFLFLLFWFLAAFVGAFVAPTTVARGAAELRRHAVRLAGIGLLVNLSLALTSVLAIALIQVFVGIPLLILLLVAWLCLGAVALAAVFHAVGERIAEHLSEGAMTGYVQLLAGALVFGVIHFLPFLGELAFVAACLAGSGATVATRLGRREPAPLAGTTG